MTTYPNPTDKLLNIVLPSNEQKVNIKIVDMLGKVVFEENKTIAGNSFSIDLNELNSGMYILNISSDKEQFVEKIQVQK